MSRVKNGNQVQSETEREIHCNLTFGQSTSFLFFEAAEIALHVVVVDDEAMRGKSTEKGREST